MKRGVKLCILWFVVCCSISGCSFIKNGEEIKQEDTKELLKIGFSIDSLILERWQRDRDIFTLTAQNMGVEVNVQNANGDIHTQIKQIEYFIRQQMDAIVILAGDCHKISGVVKKAKDAGIPVIAYDRLIENVDLDLYISFNNKEVGKLMAQELRKEIPDGGEIFMMQGAKQDHNIQFVREGFAQQLKDGGLKVVYESNCENWIPENVIDNIREALEEYPDVKGIMCGNDEIAGKIVQVLAEKQLLGKVIIVGQDGDLAACQRIVEGSQQMTVFKNIDLLAQTASECAVKLAKEHRNTITSHTIDNGGYQVPYLELSVESVTKDNIDEVIIENGFHLREDVYLNVKKNQ